MTSVKIHAFLAQAGIASRRAAENLVAENRVKVNNQPAHIGQRIDPEKDEVSVNGKPVKTSAQHAYYLVYKPVGYVSTTADELGRQTVLDLIPSHFNRVYPVGRLDAESEGLMLLTNDGQLAFHLSHPKFEIPKTYHVQVTHPLSDKALGFIRKGAKLVDGWIIPDDVTVLPKAPAQSWLSITVREGRKHVIRRLLRRTGYEVKRLIRVELGPFTVEELSGQTFRKLSESDVHERLSEFEQTPSPTSSPQPVAESSLPIE